MDLEQEVKRTLNEHFDSPPPHGSQWREIERRIRRSRTRRAIGGTLGATAVIALLVIFIPRIGSHPLRVTTSPSPSASRPATIGPEPSTKTVILMHGGLGDGNTIGSAERFTLDSTTDLTLTAACLGAGTLRVDVVANGDTLMTPPFVCDSDQENLQSKTVVLGSFSVGAKFAVSVGGAGDGIYYVLIERATPAGHPVRAAGVTPARAEQLVRKTVTGSSPLLFPTMIPRTWKVDVDASSDFFSLIYRSGLQRVTLAIEVPNLPAADNRSSQTSPDFHGDKRSLYQVQFNGRATSPRYLMWIEPGRPAPLFQAQGGVPYLLSSDGLTDAEFWTIANGLRS